MERALSDIFMLERWLESMHSRLVTADYESINEVRDELGRAVDELRSHRTHNFKTAPKATKCPACGTEIPAGYAHICDYSRDIARACRT
jgi:hypothetical protein